MNNEVNSNNTQGLPPITPSSPLNTLSPDTIKERIGNFMGHAYNMLTQLESQHNDSIKSDTLRNIYETTKQELETLEENLKKIANSPQSTIEEKKQLKRNLKRDLKRAEKVIAKKIRDNQIRVAAEIGHQFVDSNKENLKARASDLPTIKKKIASLAEGGLKAKWTRFLALIFKTDAVAVKAFNEAKTRMEKRSESFSKNLQKAEDLAKKSKSIVVKADDQELKKRKKVMGIDGEYYFQVSFNEKDIRKQLKSFTAQDLSQKERKPIKRGIVINKGKANEKTFNSELIPLNKAFDESVTSKIKNRVINIFDQIFGNKGISSANRYEPHLVNAWQTLLKNAANRNIFRAFRLGIISAPLEKTTESRKAYTRQMALELVKAAVVQKLADVDVSLEDARTRGLELHLNSTSLVTPDFLRSFSLIGGKENNERQMLEDQVEALHNLEKEFPENNEKEIQENNEKEIQENNTIEIIEALHILEKEFQENNTIEINGVQIPLKLTINTFNFGVNAGAVGKIKILGIPIRMGLDRQYEYNKEAWKRLKTQVKEIKEKACFHPDHEKTSEMRELIDSLMQDVDKFMDDKSAYLKGHIQYEAPAKIALITHLMDRIADELADPNQPTNQPILGYAAAYNCKSGKDRSALMVAAKAYAIMIEEDTIPWPLSEYLQEDGHQQFMDIYMNLLENEGSLDEITKTNTDAEGVKVGPEAQFKGMSDEQFSNITRLSNTTSS